MIRDIANFGPTTSRGFPGIFRSEHFQRCGIVLRYMQNKLSRFNCFSRSIWYIYTYILFIVWFLSDVTIIHLANLHPASTSREYITHGYIVPQIMLINVEKRVKVSFPYWWFPAAARSSSARMGGHARRDNTHVQKDAFSRCFFFHTFFLPLCYIDFGQLGTGWTSSLSSTPAASSRPMSFNMRYNLYTVESRLVPQRWSSCWVAVVGHRARLLITFQGKSIMLATLRQLLGGLIGFK